MSNPRAGTVDEVRRMLSPGWVATHVLVLLTTVVMAWLGYWQWTSGLMGHSGRNTGYALQWWAFAIFAIYFWIKLMRDALRGGTPSVPSERSPLARFRQPAASVPVGIREYRTPPPPVVAADSDLGRYNAYLAALDAVPADESAPSAQPGASVQPLASADPAAAVEPLVIAEPLVSAEPGSFDPSVSDDRLVKENP